MTAGIPLRNLILTGYMGTGKSTVARLLADRLNFALIDLDQEIVLEAGLPITEIFARHGETFFRELESKIVTRFAACQHQVISTGGGAVISPENRRQFRLAGFIVNLTASPEEIFRRLQHQDDRPLLNADKSLERIRAMLDEREPFYADADIRIDTVDKKVEDVADEILRLTGGTAARGEDHRRP